MAIRRLPDDVAARIGSSESVTSLNAVVAGLLRNSLDAAAARVNVRLDYARGSCVVEDDGLGIEPREFGPDGGLGKPHHTSRWPPSPHFHGSRGDFLAFVASLSLLTLTSHHHAHLSQASLCVHDSRVLARQLPAPPEQRLETYSHGTRVSVHALFGSMPVRLKHQAAIFSTRSGVEREWGQLVRELVALLVAWPSSVSVSLGEKAHGRELRLKSAADIDLVLGTARLFSQASLADSGHADSWKSVSASARRVRIKGCMSATPVATRRSQMMSLGIQPILNSRDNNTLYEAVNDVFRNSSFGVVEDDAPGPTARPRKALERWPMFYLHIMLSGADAMTVEEVVDSSHRVLTSILELLKAVSYEFLKKQGLRPRAVARSTDPSPRRNSTSKSLTGRSRLSLEPKPARQRSLTGSETRPGRLFDDWDRVKVGWAAPMAKEQGKWPTGPQAAVQRLIGEGGKLLRAPFPDAGTDEQAPHPPVVCGDASGDASADVAAAKRERKRTGALEHRMQPQPSDWLKSLVQSWKNPVFDAVENAIPSLHHACGRSAVEFEPRSISLAGRLSKAALGEAETIAQVDGKFVLVRLPLDKADEDASGSGLVMIDQHAADERCRLEELLDGYFEDRPGTGGVQPVVEALDKPVVFEAPEREEELLRRYREHFAAWGVTYRVQRGSAAGAACRVKVVGLPPSILARCRSEPRVLIDLVRKELWALADDDAGPRPRGAAEDAATTWTSRFRGCPLGILALLCSRSCRSAIMFNEELSQSECGQLVQRLSRCAFPFQCAHGRPSMVPLVDLGSGAGRPWHDGQPVGLAEWKRWLA